MNGILLCGYFEIVRVHWGYFVERSWKALSCASGRLYERNSGNVSRLERVIAQGTRRNTECICDKPYKLRSDSELLRCIELQFLMDINCFESGTKLTVECSRIRDINERMWIYLADVSASREAELQPKFAASEMIHHFTWYTIVRCCRIDRPLSLSLFIPFLIFKLKTIWMS